MPDIGVKPLWSTTITAESITTWRSGVGGFPKYGNTLIFPYGAADWDSRICGLDLESGELKWIFPALEKTRNYIFDGNGYFYGNLLVAMSKTPSNSDLMCINLDTQELVWQKDKTVMGVGNGRVYGYEDKVYWMIIQNASSKIYVADINSGEVSIFYTPAPEDGFDDVWISGFCIYNRAIDGHPQMIFRERYHQIGSGLEYKHYFVKYDLLTGLVEKLSCDYYPPLPYFGVVDGKYHGQVDGIVSYNDIETNSTIWQYNTGRYPDDWPGYPVLVGDVLFCGGNQHSVGLDAKTGRKLYDIETRACLGASSDGNYIYLYKSYIQVIDPHTGKTLDIIVCPEVLTGGDAFSGPPTFHNGKAYLMSGTTAYCYPTYPFSEQ